MSILDWSVLGLTIVGIVCYGIWKSRKSNRNIDAYLLGNHQTKWFTIALSIMATQASAITFLSAPGQAFTDGMRFIQLYLGLPIAMIVLAATVVPIYHKLNIFTAYEYLEKRFDLKTRSLAAILFLTQRGLAAGFTIFAPSLILSSLLGWNIYYTNLLIGITVIIYTVIGGTNAVSHTHKGQMAIIMGGMFVAFMWILYSLPDEVNMMTALHIAGKSGKLNIVDFSFDWQNKYTIWSGLIGGFFLALSYFGTDQSQVQRYLSGQSVKESRNALLFNGLLKIPMQFFILLIGVLLFVFYQFQPGPLHFNKVNEDQIQASTAQQEYSELTTAFSKAQMEQKKATLDLAEAINQGNDASIEPSKQRMLASQARVNQLRDESKQLIKQTLPTADTNDTNYIFFHYVLQHLPAGLIGLLIAVILSASMSSTSAELNALASTSLIDIYKRNFVKNASDKHYVLASKWLTLFWGVYGIVFAMFANRLGTLIEAVNIMGSLVYGTILGVFLVAFYFKKIRATPTFFAAIISFCIVLGCFLLPNIYPKLEIPYLWFNVIGCLSTVAFAGLFNGVMKGVSSKN